MNHDRTLYAQIELGEGTDQFLKSDMGKYIIGRCTQIVENAKNELAVAPPEDVDGVRELQRKIREAVAVPRFLNELLVEGRQALEIMESSDNFVED